MSRRVTQAAIAFVVLFAAAQLVRPERLNPPIDPALTIEAHMDAASGLPVLLDRACRDCHSNETSWPWYTHIAPVSWVLARGVAEGRSAVNFSEWGTYSPDQRRTLLAAVCDDVSSGKMPGRPWTLLHPEARLSAHDVETICGARP
jgi:heme-binding protein